MNTNEEGYKISGNALKVMFFESMHMHEIDIENRESHRFKLGIRNHIYEMAVKESNEMLMYLVLDGANIVDDLELVAKATQWIKANCDVETARLDYLLKDKGYIARHKEIIIQFALGAGMKVSEGFEELSDIALLATDEPYTLNDLVY